MVGGGLWGERYRVSWAWESWSREVFGESDLTQSERAAPLASTYGPALYPSPLNCWFVWFASVGGGAPLSVPPLPEVGKSE